ncbi:MAG: hypothetical protein AAF621_07430 [Pseudomonadota bacterium]
MNNILKSSLTSGGIQAFLNPIRSKLFDRIDKSNLPPNAKKATQIGLFSTSLMFSSLAGLHLFPVVKKKAMRPPLWKRIFLDNEIKEEKSFSRYKKSLAAGVVTGILIPPFLQKLKLYVQDRNDQLDKD